LKKLRDWTPRMRYRKSADLISIKSRVSFITVVLFMISAIATLANAAQSNPSTVKFDSSNVELRSVSKVSLSQFHTDPDFNYDYKNANGLSLWDRIQLWIWQNVLRFLFSEKTAVFWQILIYLAAGGILVFFISRLLSTTISGLFRPAQKDQPVFEDDISSGGESGPDLDAQIQEKIRAGQFREAVRLLYFNLLKKMVSKDIIRWKIDKTNRDYLQEMDNPGLKQDFEKITWLFNRIWYGHFIINEQFFNESKKDFEEFENSLSSMRT